MPEKIFGIGDTLEAAVAQALAANGLDGAVRFQLLEHYGESDGLRLRFTVKLLVWRA
jgi:hypothetical protein